MADFRLFGGVEVRVAGRQLELGQPRQRAVLAALLVDAGRVVPMDILIGRVWGEAPPATARHSLYSHVARVRQSLGRISAVETQPVRLVRGTGGYLLDVEPDRVDVLARPADRAGAKTRSGNQPLHDRWNAWQDLLQTSAESLSSSRNSPGPARDLRPASVLRRELGHDRDVCVGQTVMFKSVQAQNERAAGRGAGRRVAVSWSKRARGLDD